MAQIWVISRETSKGLAENQILKSQIPDPQTFTRSLDVLPCISNLKKNSSRLFGCFQVSRDVHLWWNFTNGNQSKRLTLSIPVTFLVLHCTHFHIRLLLYVRWWKVLYFGWAWRAQRGLKWGVASCKHSLYYFLYNMKSQKCSFSALKKGGLL